MIRHRFHALCPYFAMFPESFAEYWIKRLAAKDAPANLETVLAAPDDPRLPPQSVDTIFFCDVLHHIESRAAYYAKIGAALKPGGRIVVIDFHDKELPVGPPPSMKLADGTVIGDLERAGFRLLASMREAFVHEGHGLRPFHVAGLKILKFESGIPNKSGNRPIQMAATRDAFP